MTYENALQKIHSLLTFGSRPGLDRILTLLDRMGNPQDKLKYIHVAGTNGKGSVCAMISAVLVEEGYKTGLFISPYITDFRERIQINNKMISKELLVSAVENTFPLIEQLQNEGIVITEFEYVNALQFYIHSKAECDVVVLETGLGGLLDCTNVIKSPLCSVLTSIGLDHTALLGDTIEKIAEQKCGILKKNSIAITSLQNIQAMNVIKNTAEHLEIPLYKAENICLNIKEENLSGSIFNYKNLVLKLPLAGNHQIENAKTALCAIEALRTNNLLSISDESIIKGFAKAVNPARLEALRKNPTVLLDGAHNPDGVNALQHFIKKHLADKHIICILGMLADKDIDSSINLLAHTFDKVICVPVNNPRAISAEMLAEKCTGHFNEVDFCNSPEKAFDLALIEAGKNDSVIIICGSLYLAGEIRPYIIEK